MWCLLLLGDEHKRRLKFGCTSWFQAFAAKQMRTALFWFFISLDFLVEPMGFPETSVRIYHYSLLNNPEERSSNLGVYC